MKLNLIETKDILDLEKEIGQELVVNERAISVLRRAHDDLPRYYACFDKAELLIDGHLIGSFGNGDTIDDAIKDYCRQISNCLIVFGAYSSERKEMKLPKLVHTNLLNR